MAFERITIPSKFAFEIFFLNRDLKFSSPEKSSGIAAHGNVHFSYRIKKLGTDHESLPMEILSCI